MVKMVLIYVDTANLPERKGFKGRFSVFFLGTLVVNDPFFIFLHSLSLRDVTVGGLVAGPCDLSARKSAPLVIAVEETAPVSQVGGISSQFWNRSNRPILTTLNRIPYTQFDKKHQKDVSFKKIFFQLIS